MTTVVPFPSPATPAGSPDPVSMAALDELLQLALVVARVASGLAAAEGRALEALGDTAAAAARDAVGSPGSLAEAIEAGQRADASDAARDAIAARVASITATFDKAARAVRRTVALRARLADGRGFRGPLRAAAGEAGRGGSVPGSGGRAANDAEPAERMDAPEWGDELGGASDEDVVRAICRDLDEAGAGLGGGEPAGAEADSPGDDAGLPLPVAIEALCARVGASVGWSGEVRTDPGRPGPLVREPDT